MVTSNDEIFLDSVYTIALLDVRDQWHSNAIGWATTLQRIRPRYITTQAILIETGNMLNSPHSRPSFLRVVETFMSDERVTVLEVGDKLFRVGLDISRKHHDKYWGMTDCISFAVMQERRMQFALTADRHFEQAGFVPLLRLAN